MSLIDYILLSNRSLVVAAVVGALLGLIIVGCSMLYCQVPLRWKGW